MIQIRTAQFHLSLLVATLICSCGIQPKQTTGDENSPGPVIQDSSVYSADELTKLLERRWSLKEIREFCLPSKRHDPSIQNLVLDAEGSWRDKLYEGNTFNLDIFWYATTSGGKLGEYSLNVSSGNDHWLLEIGDAGTARSKRQLE